MSGWRNMSSVLPRRLRKVSETTSNAGMSAAPQVGGYPRSFISCRYLPLAALVFSCASAMSSIACSAALSGGMPSMLPSTCR